MKLLAIDGNSIINRAFYGIKGLATRDGMFTNGIYGFMNILLRLIEMTEPDSVAVAFDLKAPTFRHQMYSEYKAGRRGMPPELAEQMPVMMDILRLMGYQVLEQEGYEADDILGTLAELTRSKGGTCVIATGDRDSLQLVGDGVKVYLAATRMGKPEVIIYDEAMIAEKYNGLTPKQLIEVKALMGDSSDNIPGVAGVGEKTALSLIAQFGSLEGVYENIESDSIKAGVRAKLESDKDNAYLSRKLGEINKEVPISCDEDCYKIGEMQSAELAETLRGLEMFSMIERLGITGLSAPVDNSCSLKAVKSCELNDLTSEKIYLLLNGGYCYLSDGEKATCVPTDDAIKFVLDKKILTDDAKALFHISPCVNVVFDTSLAGYLLDPDASDYSASRLCERYSANADESCDDLTDIARFVELCSILEEKIEEVGSGSLLYDVEIPLARVLADMETIGFEVDAESIALYGKMLEDRTNTLSSEIYNLVGYEFNLNSPKQLGVALFEKLGLPAGKKTKSGYSTNADVLEGLKDKHPAVSKLLEYRTLSKLKSTYCDGLLKAVGEDGRIRSTLNQTETRTGRISSAEPNLQNIPVRTEVGREFRRFFTAPKGRVLCDADYSQIELRVLAHMSGDEAMIEAFKNGADIHTITAARVFGMPEDMVTQQMRSSAKAVNFGIVYGIGAFSLAKDIGVSYGDAKRFIEGYLTNFSGVKSYMEKTLERAKDLGYVETAFGRRRYLPELKSSNGMLRAFGERVARNAPIQGTAADIIKIAMVRVYDRLKEEKLDAKLILQIHDELIVESNEADAPRAAQIISEEMENACKLSVPMPADVHIGKTWYDAKE